MLKTQLFYEIDNKDEAINLISENCNFVNKLYWQFFIVDDSDIVFNAKYVEDKLYLYCREIKRTFFNPLIIVEFFDSNINVKIKYNKINLMTIMLIGILFFCIGTIGAFCNALIISYLPLILFIGVILLSFCIYSKKIEKIFNEIYM